MPQFISIVIGLIAIYGTTVADPDQQKHSMLNNDNLEDLSLFDFPYELPSSRYTNAETAFMDREKRFFDSLFPQFDVISRSQNSYSSYEGYSKKQYNQNKGGGRFADFFRNPQDFWHNIFSNQRPTAVLVPVIVPIQPIDCGCSGATETPAENKKPVQPSNGDEIPIENSTITLPNRFNEEVDNDDDDGRRPISFKPQEPNRPLSIQPPPFEHGSVQAGVEPSTSSNNAPGLSPSSQPEGTPVIMPTICDGAVVACCLQLNIGNCFERQGCSDPSIYGDPCNPSVVSKVLEKFQRYYKERGIQKNFYP